MAKTPVRGIRVPDELWERATAAVEARGTNVSAEVNAFLERLARRHERETAAD
jgi:antitoxin component of RelBE/YafQ-DinJ toxin-antitoxin module